jgi:FlaA1/EpsC-like NDP-sugar epimerase
LKRKLLLFLLDVLATIIAGVAALFIRFGFDFVEMDKYNESIYFYVIIAAVVYVLNGNYKIVWRYANQKDFLIIFRGTLFSYLLTVMFFHFYRSFVLPRSVGMITFLGSFMFILTGRLLYQFFVQTSKNHTRKFLIVGTENMAVSLAEDIEKNKVGEIVAFVDDDKSKIGRTIMGKKVYGPISKIGELSKVIDFDELIIAIPGITSNKVNQIVDLVDLSKVKVKIIPSFEEILSEKVKIDDIRNISLEDIIGRKPIDVNLQEIGEYLKDKVVLVTGAGGSIGSELCRQIVIQKPRSLILLGRGENSIYEISEELNEKYADVEIFRAIGDVENREWMEKIFEKFKPDIVFHAAAHKHVPLMEENPYEAIRVNVFGTINLADISCKFNVEKFVFISTDKAVNPTSFMGLSKRIAELYILSKKCSTRFSIVRFGNVIGSRGSVLWKFKKQIEQGKPVTITHPDMRRYFMSIPEAVSLVLESTILNGNLFVLDMGEQIPIEEIARKLGKILGKDNIEIVYTGIRRGEKLYEELFYPYEVANRTKHPKIFSVKYDKPFNEDEIKKNSLEILENLKGFNFEKACEYARKLVPEFKFRGGIE